MMNLRALGSYILNALDTIHTNAVTLVALFGRTAHIVNKMKEFIHIKKKVCSGMKGHNMKKLLEIFI